MIGGSLFSKKLGKDELTVLSLKILGRSMQSIPLLISVILIKCLIGLICLSLYITAIRSLYRHVVCNSPVFCKANRVRNQLGAWRYSDQLAIVYTGVNQKVLPVLLTETLLHIWLSTEYYGCRSSSTAVDTVSLHALDPTVPRKRMQIGFLLAPIVKEVSNIVSNLLMSFLLQRLALEFVCHQNLLPFSFLVRIFIITKALDKPNCLG